MLDHDETWWQKAFAAAFTFVVLRTIYLVVTFVALTGGAGLLLGLLSGRRPSPNTWLPALWLFEPVLWIVILTISIAVALVGPTIHFHYTSRTLHRGSRR